VFEGEGEDQRSGCARRAALGEVCVCVWGGLPCLQCVCVCV
jgi:hypothetical protein